MSRKLRKGPVVLLALLVVGGLACVGWRYHQDLVYGPALAVGPGPDSAGLDYEEFWVRTPDGLDLLGWYLPADAAGRTDAASTLLLFHDAHEVLSDTLPRLQLFHALGLNVFTFDYRGFGRSEGIPTEKGLGLDALAVYFQVTETRAVPVAQLVLYGEGLGAAVALELATSVRLAGIIAEGAFTSLGDWIKSSHPNTPWSLLVGDQFNTLKHIRRVNVPVLLLHSIEDERVPFRHAEVLLAAAANPKQLVKLRGSHGAAPVESAEAFRMAIEKFVDQYAPTPSATATARRQTDPPSPAQP